MELRKKIINGKCNVFDRFRQKWVACTPEEEVRQCFCNYLVENKNYPAISITNESVLYLNGTARRCDTIIHKGLKPVVLIEFKAPDVVINSDVMNQALSYNSELKARYVILTNSKSIFCIEFDFEKSSHKFLSDIPSYDTI